MKYGRLTVIREYKSRYPGGRPCRRFECVCDCGNTTNPTKEKVIKGETLSCGCLQKEVRGSFGLDKRKQFGESATNDVYYAYRRSAMAREYEFSLSIDEFVEIITSPCIYCGSQFGNKHSKNGQFGHFDYTGIDRFNNAVGYTLENSVPCCSVCNRIKTDMDIDAMYTHISKMIEHKNMFKRTA